MRFYLAVLFCALIVAGCSQSGGSPVSPSNSASFDEISVIGLTESGDTLSAVGLMGVYELTVNPETMELNLVSKRLSTIGESYIVSGVGFWTMAPCPNCLGIKSYSLGPNNELVITFTSDHPFPAGNPGLPPTAANRLDLDVFDLAALVVPVSGAATPTNYSLIGSSAYDNICVDPDGYTKELENVTGDRAVVPYFLVVDESGSSSPTYNEYPMGATNKEFDIRLNLAGGAVPAFDIFLTMGYGASAKKTTRLTPKYYNPEFNRKAAWKVEVIPPAGGWDDDDSTTVKNVIVKVYDWQQGAAVSSTAPYSDETDTKTVFAASEVASVSVEIPGMNSSLSSATSPTGGTGSTTDPLVYTIPIANQLLLPAGEYKALVKVADGRSPGVSSVGGEVDTLVNTPNGIALNWYSMPEFATYQTFVAQVVKGCGPITGRIVSPALANYETITSLANGQILGITVNATSVGAIIAQYDADFNYNGVTFTSDAVSTTGVFNTLGPIAVPSPCSSNIPYTFQIAFRATDNCVPPNSTIFAIYTGRADYCQMTTNVGNVSITINRESTSSSYHHVFNMNTGPWTLNWAPLSGAQEYAIYRDNDPGNYALPAWTIASLTDNLQLVGTTTTNSYTESPIPMILANRYVQGWTYVVRARAAAGNSYTEGPNSELAFIMTNGFETSTGSQNLSEGWTGWCHQSNYPTYTFFMFQYYNYQQYGQYNWHCSVYCSNYAWPYWGTPTPNPMCGGFKRTPLGIPNASRYFDSSAMLYQMYDTPGMFLVTAANLPTNNYGVTSVPMVDWVSVYSSSPYRGYNIAGQTQFATYGVPAASYPGTGATCWGTASPNRQRIGADVDASGDPTDPFIGIVFINDSTSQVNTYPNIDEVAIMIY